MRAISTAASVYPGRTSTPPFLARSGKTCPGRARSWGRVRGSTAVRIVVARSAAEIPVVTPRRASIETVNAVPNREVFSATCGGKCNSSHRSSVSGKQISPRPSPAMKLIFSGVTNYAAHTRSPSFSRSSSSTIMIIRPSRMSAAASGIEANAITGNSGRESEIRVTSCYSAARAFGDLRLLRTSDLREFAQHTWQSRQPPDSLRHRA